MQRQITLRAGLNYDTDQVSLETGLACPEEEGMTQQQFKEETDINEIVRRFGLTGEIPDNPKIPQYGDFTGITDYQTAMNAVLQAEADFMALPGEVRARFQNDPQQLLEFVGDDKNMEEAQKLGLIKPKPVPERTTVQAVDELAAALKPK